MRACSPATPWPRTSRRHLARGRWCAPPRRARRGAAPRNVDADDRGRTLATPPPPGCGDHRLRPRAPPGHDLIPKSQRRRSDRGVPVSGRPRPWRPGSWGVGPTVTERPLQRVPRRLQRRGAIRIHPLRFPSPPGRRDDVTKAAVLVAVGPCGHRVSVFRTHPVGSKPTSLLVRWQDAPPGRWRPDGRSDLPKGIPPRER